MPLLPWCVIWDTKNSLSVPEFPLCLPLKSSINDENVTLNLTYEDKPKILRDWDRTHSKSPLNIFYVNLLYVPHIQAKPPLLQSILRKKKPAIMLESPHLLLLLFLLRVFPIRPGDSQKIRKSYLGVFQLFCAVDTFLIKLRCCLYFGGPLAASKTKQNSGILFQWDTEVSSQDIGNSIQYWICKAEMFIS